MPASPLPPELPRAWGLPPPLEVAPLGEGRINRTLRAVYPGKLPPRVHQRLNPQVFPRPEAVAGNLERVYAALEAPGAAAGERLLPRLVPTARGASHWVDDGGHWWRTWEYVADSDSCRHTTDPDRLRAAGHAYGRLLGRLQRVPAPALVETIPGFHDTPARLARLAGALERDRAGRAPGAAPAAAALLRRGARAGLVTGALADGRIPRRPVHNDTKLDNLLFARGAARVLCVLDLDTVMPGALPHDFGDLVRATVSPAPAEEGAGTVAFSPERFAAVAAGFLEGVGGQIQPAERRLLPAAPGILALELAARFLTDHLEGDPYFGAPEPGANLRRALRQLALLEALEDAEDEMAAILERI